MYLGDSGVSRPKGTMCGYVPQEESEIMGYQAPGLPGNALRVEVMPVRERSKCIMHHSLLLLDPAARSDSGAYAITANGTARPRPGLASEPTRNLEKPDWESRGARIWIESEITLNGAILQNPVVAAGWSRTRSTTSLGP